MARTTAFKWRAILGLIILYLAVWYDWQWMWGVLFLLWVIPDLITGESYFMELITKKDNPILYWIIVGSWLLLSVYSILSAFYPDWK